MRKEKWFVAPRFEKLRPFLEEIPSMCRRKEGQLIHDSRNQLRILHHGDEAFVVKCFALPSLPNRLIYAIFRQSKAERSFRYASLLNQRGFGSPQPVAFAEQKMMGLWLTHSYYVSLLSRLPYTFDSLTDGTIAEDEQPPYLEAVGRFTGRFHNANMIHKDYNGGNLLLGTEQGEARVELVDLNRIRFRPVSAEEGCRNFAERIVATERQWQVMARAYAEVRGLDADWCLASILQSTELKEEQA